MSARGVAPPGRTSLVRVGGQADPFGDFQTGERPCMFIRGLFYFFIADGHGDSCFQNGGKSAGRRKHLSVENADRKKNLCRSLSVCSECSLSVIIYGPEAPIVAAVGDT